MNVNKKAHEVNFDGLVGPTHNYAGLSFGNVASEQNLNTASNPKEAAKQGLRKMKALADRGFRQAVFPPVLRPDLNLLRRLGFGGTEAQILDKVYKTSPALLASVYSASSMWVANAATVSPSADTQDGRLHITPANLQAKLHRSTEVEQTTKILRSIFNDKNFFKVHSALPGLDAFADEGAANHTRLCNEYGEQGVELFVYGRSHFDASAPKPKRYPARQTLEASQAIARLHGLKENNCVMVQQNPDVIDQGVFHNDVIAVGNQDVLFYHEQAFLEERRVLSELNQKLGREVHAIRVSDEQVKVAEAVSSYLFNSQLLSKPDGSMLLLVPEESRHSDQVSQYLKALLDGNNPISEVLSFDLTQSMKNGGGPACLRLRVAMTDEELAAIPEDVVMNDRLYERLDAWVDSHYRDRLALDDLRDPALIDEVRTTVEGLNGILSLNAVSRS